MKKLTRQCLIALMVCCSFGLMQQANAQCAAGETAYGLTISPLSFPAEISWDIVDDATSTVVASAACGTYAAGLAATDTICLTTGTSYTLNTYDDWGDTWNGGTYDLADLSCGSISSGDPDNGLAGDGTDDCIGADLEQSYSFTAGGPYMGCTDPTAINYSPCATVDDGSCLYPAANDECVDAIPVPVGSCVTSTNIGATYSASAGAPDITCYAVSPTPLDIWFATMVPASGNIEVMLPSVPGFSSFIEFYGGSCGSLVNLTASLGTSCFNVGAGGSIYAFGLTPGAIIYIRYWDFANDDFGVVDICVNDAGPSATNDECSGSVNIPVGACATGTNFGATYSASAGPWDPSCFALDSAIADIWFDVTVPASGNLQLDLIEAAGGGFTSFMEFYGGSCGSLVNLTGLGVTPCNTYFPGGDPAILTGLTPGATIYVRFWDFGSDNFGPYEICASDPVVGCVDPCSANYDSTAVVDDGSCVGFPTDGGEDACASATALAGPGMYEQYNAMATSTGGDITLCTFNDSIDVWFSYNVPAGLDTFKVWTCGSTYDTGLSFWDACGGTEIACNDDGSFGPGGISGSVCGGTTFSSLITLSDAALDAVEGTTILIRVAGYNGQSGCGELNVAEVPTVSACDASVPPTGFGATVSGGLLTFNWDAFPGAVGCQLNAGPSGAGFPITQNILGAPTSLGPIPTGGIPAGNYQARLRCACQITPSIIVSPFTNTIQFTIPSPRLGAFTEVALTPNPATDVLNLNINGEAQANVSFAIVDLLGRVLSTDVQDLAEGNNSISFDVSTFESGLYFLQITSGTDVTTEQFEVIK